MCTNGHAGVFDCVLIGHSFIRRLRDFLLAPVTGGIDVRPCRRTRCDGTGGDVSQAEQAHTLAVCMRVQNIIRGIDTVA